MSGLIKVAKQWKLQKTFWEHGHHIGNGRVEQLDRLRILMRVHLLHAFVRFRMERERGDDENDAMDGSVMWLALLNDGLAAFARCLTESKVRDSHKLVLQACTNGILAELAVPKFIGF